MALSPDYRRAKIMSVVRVPSGNFLEMYDFMVFGYYAAAGGRSYWAPTLTGEAAAPACSSRWG